MKSPAFSFYVRDWLCSKTVSKLHSKPSSKGVSAYLYLLCSSWLEDPPATLPNDHDQLAAYARVSRQEWDSLWPDLESQFQLNPEGRLVNCRLMEEWLKQQKRKHSGSLGGQQKVANSVAKHVAKPLANSVAALEDENEDENGIQNSGVNEVSELSAEVLRLYKRPATEQLTYAEQCLAVEIVRRPKWRDEFRRLKEFKQRGEFAPQSVSALLNKWQETLDRSRNSKKKEVL